MNKGNATGCARSRTTPLAGEPAPPRGIEEADITLPSGLPAVAAGPRDTAAIVVYAITRGFTPEGIARAHADSIGARWDELASSLRADPLELAEARAHVDLIAAALDGAIR